jgi:hypothetical protein
VAEIFEDISHAAINVNFMVLCSEHGILFTREDLARLEKCQPKSGDSVD